MIGKTISHYRILEKLGEGGMGVVYKARDTRLDRMVALKFLPKHHPFDQEAKTRFMHEAKTASALNHPNITTIYEIEEVEGECFISMEYVEGKSIKELIKDRQPEGWDIGRIIDVGIQIAEGLSKAHQKGIVHRDIKSDNIMLTAEGLVKIMDFGLAKLKGVSQLTETQMTLGTTQYMSPEQAQSKEVDHRGDIFSFGVVLYEMVTGQMPFQGEQEQVVIYSILNEEPQPITGIRPDIPTEFEQIVNKALIKGLDSRYQKTVDFLADLKNFRKNLRSIKDQPSTKKPQPSIAVLPFTDLSPDKDQEYFCDGMAEEIINGLTHVEGLRVVARSSAFLFRGKKIDIREIGRKLNVETLLEGTVQKAGKRLRVMVQLINAADGYHLWSAKYDRDMEHIFTIQDEISLAVVDRLRVKLLKKEKARLVKRFTDDEEAYNLYLRGRYFWNRRYEGGLQKGIECFQQAIDTDPLYALAYAGKADCYVVLGHYGWLHPKEAYPRARAAAEKTLEIDDTLAEAHASMGWIGAFYDWDWAAAENEFRRALDLNPNYATGHEWYAVHLGNIGRYDKAIAELKRALELEPLSLIINAVEGLAYTWLRQYDKAIDKCRITLEMDPNFLFAHLFQSWAYAAKGMWEETIKSAQRAVTLSGESPFALWTLGTVYAMSGQENQALKILNRLNELSTQKYVSPFCKAMIYVGLSDMDQAFKYLEKSYLERESFMATINTLPFFDSMRSDPRFGVLLKKMGLEK